MNSSDQILIVDVNVIIHLEKVGLLDELIKDKNIRIVDLVLYEEYEYKENLMSERVRKIEQIHLSDEEIFEANQMYEENRRNSFFDYCSFIAARNNGYGLLTGDWKLKKSIREDMPIYGVIWYVKKLREKNIIDDIRLKEIYESWLSDPSVFIREDILSDLILELTETDSVID